MGPGKQVRIGLALATVMGASAAVTAAPDLGPPAPGAKPTVPAAPAAPVTPAAPAAPVATGEALSLLDCVEEALVNSPDIGASRSALRGARGPRIQATAAGLPQISVSYAEIIEKHNVVATAGGGASTTTLPNLHAAEVDLNWLLFSGGALQANRAMARLAEIAAGQQLDATVNQVIGGTVQAYLQLLRATELRQVADRTVDLATEQVKTATANFDADTAPRVDVLRAQSALASARQAQLQANNGIELARAALLSVMGRKQTGNVTVQALAHQLAAPPELLDSLKLAIAQRPELKAQQSAIRIDEQAVKAARAGYYPTLDLSGKYTHTEPNGQGGNPDNYQLMLVASWNVWDWSNTTGKVIEKNAAVVTARNRLERAVRDVELDVRRAVLNIGEARQRVDQAKAEVETAGEALRIEQLRYQEGEGIYLQLLDARRALSSAEVDLVTAYYDNALGEAAWLAATGGYVSGGKAVLPGGVTGTLPAAKARPGKDLDQVRAEYGLPPEGAAKAPKAAPAPAAPGVANGKTAVSDQK